MNHKLVPKWKLLAAILLVSDLFLPVCAYAQSSAFSFSPIVKRGDPSPDGGRFFVCNDCVGRINGARAFNNRGDIAISADTEGKCYDALFFVSTERNIVLSDSCSETPFGKLGYGHVNINDQGHAAFIGLPIVNDRFMWTVFLNSEGQLTRIVAEGDRTPTGSTFKGCGFSEPSINDRGEIAFGACAADDQGLFDDGIFLYSGGAISLVAGATDPTPIGGTFNFNSILPLNATINDTGEILFQGGVYFGGVIPGKFGLFLKIQQGFEKIVVDGDRLDDRLTVDSESFTTGDLNDRGEVAFTALLNGASESGIFLRSGQTISKIMTDGDPSPLGGMFQTLDDPDLLEQFQFIRPRINNNGAVAFKAKVKDGSSPLGIFLASPRAIVKVVAVGDRLPSGEVIKEIDTFALNDKGEVAFFAYAKKGEKNPLGIFKAAPLSPSISRVKLKRKQSRLELRVDGEAMITNDTVIEVNGVALDVVSYPESLRQSGGTTRRTVSRDARLEELIPAGRTVEVTLFNRLTNRRSATASFTR
jgi:hypothetical protein